MFCLISRPTHISQTLQGAVCLDGSPPGYYFRPGKGCGAAKWIIHLAGGAFCYTKLRCYLLSLTYIGSSKNWPPSATLHGLMSDDSTVNPDFYQWNVAYVMYCDGAFFTGYV